METELICRIGSEGEFQKKNIILHKKKFLIYKEKKDLKPELEFSLTNTKLDSFEDKRIGAYILRVNFYNIDPRKRNFLFSFSQTNKSKAMGSIPFRKYRIDEN